VVIQLKVLIFNALILLLEWQEGYPAYKKHSTTTVLMGTRPDLQRFIKVGQQTKPIIVVVDLNEVVINCRWIV